jgi:hypothetical protein
MKLRLLLFLATIPPLFLAACGGDSGTPAAASDSADKAAEDVVKELERIPPIIAGVTDEASATAAAQKLAAIKDRVVAISERVKKLGAPRKETVDKLGPRFDAAMDSTRKNIVALKDSKAALIVGKAFEEVGNAVAGGKAP